MKNLGHKRRPVALLASALALGLPIASPARAAIPLVAVPVSAHGWHHTRISARAARADLAHLQAGSVRQTDPRDVEAVAARRGRASVRDEAFVFASARTARSVVRAWGGRRAAGAAVGQGGRLLIAGRSASVIWREGARVGLLSLRAAAPGTALRAQALGDARFADGFLRLQPPTDSWQRILDRIDGHGAVSHATALQAFALAYGPLPGVRTPRGPHGIIDSGTLAALWVLSARSQLTAAQRAAVDRRLGIPFGRARAAEVHGSAADGAFTPDPSLQVIADGWQAAYASRLGRPLGLAMVVGTSPDVGSAAADAIPLNAQGETGSGEPTSCRISVGPVGVAAPPERQRLLLAHEVFHCFQYALLGARVWNRPEAWIIEGLATWAAIAVDPVPFELADRLGRDRLGHGSITKYLLTPKQELFARSYDAVGFWGHLADFTGPLWSRVPAILGAPSNEAAFTAAGAPEPDVLSSWGSSAFRVGSDIGFTMHSPVEPPSFTQLEPGSLEHIVASPVAAAQYTTAQYVIDRPPPAAALMHISIDGPARLLSGVTDYTDLGDAWFCVEGRSCTCPPDSAGSVPPTEPLTTPAYLGVTGRPGTGTAGTVEPATLDDFCHPRPQPSPAPAPLGCGAGCGGSNGDPHLHPFNADPYEFQAAGEFTLVRSSTGSLEIQARQQPWERSPDLSINTAFAMRVGSSIVELDAGGEMRLLVNHRPVRMRPAHPVLLHGGGTVRTIAPLAPASGRAVAISWPDGTRAQLWPISQFGVAILLAPARSLAGKLTGLLGNFGGPANADFIGRDGHRYPADLITGDGPLYSAARYGAFGESWRIRQAGSLFTYARGKNTASYSVHGFPHGEFDLAGAPAERRAQAEDLCRQAGVVDPAAFADCVIDVLGTGDARFAASSVALQASAGRGTLVSAHPWTKLSSADDSATDVVASLATGPGGVISVAYRRDVDGSVELADLTPGVDGVALRARSLPLTGWTSIADPVLLPEASGQPGLIVAGLHGDDPADPLNGTSVFGRRADGTLGTPSALSPTVTDSLGATAVLAADGSTPLWTSTTEAQLAVHIGTGVVDLTSLSPGIPVSSALGYDRSGRLWLAWHSVGSANADGIYMLQLDPVTGSPVAGAAPLQAPASNAGNVQPRLALACAAQCRVAYVDSREQTTSTLDSWAPGEPAPTIVARGTGIRSPAIAYTTDGRLWVTWVESDGNRLMAKLGDAGGAGGTPLVIPPPPGHDTPDQTAAITTGERLVLATEWSTLAADVNSEWTTAVDPH